MAFDELSRICAVLGNATVSISGASFRAEIEKNYCYSQFIPTLSLLLFLFFPLLWVYAQNAIAQRREEEYKILYSLSVPPKKMRALCLASSLMMLPICLCILLATFGVTVLVLHFVNHVLPNIFHISVAAVGGIAPSLWGYGVIIAALLLSFLLSFFIPYSKDTKRGFSVITAIILHYYKYLGLILTDLIFSSNRSSIPAILRMRSLRRFKTS